MDIAPPGCAGGGRQQHSYLHSDHLGSNSLATTTTGAVVGNTTARYLPFGGFRTTPTAVLTDIGFTGHRHNNLPGSDLGLVYMNARFFMPSIGRFASADTIVPDPTNPQSYNRYSYVENRPLNFSDPSGHCKGSYDPRTGVATDDQECWDYLYSDFCAGGNLTTICTDWMERVAVGLEGCDDGVSACLHFYGFYWTKSELETLSHAIARAMMSLNRRG